jgi:putative membrane-bound dehydrogenase-like protein
MPYRNCLVAVLLASSFLFRTVSAAEALPTLGSSAKSLFDGATLAGWEGNPKLWRVLDGALTGGSLAETVAHNDFLATTRDFTNFVIRFQIKLTGSNGFINSGFQIRSQRVPNNTEMAGYQCDYGEPNWYGAIYDESRRNRVMSASDMNALRPVLKLNDWNDYVIRADGPRVTTWLNGVLGTDYTEADPEIPDWGKLGIQVHGGGKALVQVRRVMLEELPPTPPGKVFRGAPEPKKAASASPLTPVQEQATFTLPPGFLLELVASEDMEAGFGKFVALDWDQQGNLWTMTALEYPVDGNENPAAAKELYASRARDKVLVYAREPASPTGYAAKPRVFAEGLAIPLGLLPYRNGVYVQHGTEIVFWSDTDGDGKADRREVILSGFGVQDSHLFPHQFTRAPGNWIWMAQGAFNYGKVRSKGGEETQFDQTRMAKFRHDGSVFDITSQGPCNIWGLVLDGNGQAWIQEANDFGYPVMPFHEYANYPGCSGAQWKSYAPEFPGTAPHFQMGGTGLSGLALSDAQAWPEAYRHVFYIANPITRKIQAVRVTPDGPRFSYHKLPDFVLSSDEWFRPVALRTGPDQCLYFVDWYNKIISHNEVPRNHPERDKKRGRIWRVRHQDQPPLPVPDFTRISGEPLLAKLGGPSLMQSHLAWQAITDRQLNEFAPALRRIALDAAQPPARRLAALWALEGLHAATTEMLKALLAAPDRNVRREALRAYAEEPRGRSALDFAALGEDPDPEVRAQAARSAGIFLASSTAREATAPEAFTAVEVLARIARAPLAEPTMKSTQSGKTIKAGEAYERDFERYLARMMLERTPALLAQFLERPAAAALPLENRLVATLALEPKASASRVAALLPQLTRPPGQEEVLRLAQFLDEPGTASALQQALQSPLIGAAVVGELLRVRTRLDAAKLTPLLAEAAARLLSAREPASRELGARLAGSFQVGPVEADLARILQEEWNAHRASSTGEGRLSAPALAALQALQELKSDRVELLAMVAAEADDASVRNVAVGALGASRNPAGPQQLAKIYPELPALSRRPALTALTGTKPGALALVRSIRTGAIPKEELDAAAFDKLQAVLGTEPELAALTEQLAALFRPALRLNGSDEAWADADLTLEGAFTVETWVKLDSGIDNNDGILGAPGVLDMNFFDARFRVWVGGGIHDAIVAKKRIVPDVWTHIAVTRDASGQWRLYQNGELDNDSGTPVKTRFEHLRLGWTAPDKGTAGWLQEFRVWNKTRTADEIRADFDRSFEGEQPPAGMVHYFSGAGPWGKLHAGAKVAKTADFPSLLTSEQAAAMAKRFGVYRSLAEKNGDRTRGETVFKAACQSCHSVGGQGGQVGPVLNGAGASGVEALLRNILTPNAAMEAGYRAFRVELKDGDVIDGIRVSEDKNGIVLRRPNVEDTRVAPNAIRRAGFTKVSMMPEGLLEAMPAEDVTSLFAYLKTLR